jgi:hypothetical protein
MIFYIRLYRKANAREYYTNRLFVLEIFGHFFYHDFRKTSTS